MDMKDVNDWASRKNAEGGAAGGATEGGEDEEHDPAECVADIREMAEGVRELTDIEGLDVEALATKLEEVADEIENALPEGDEGEGGEGEGADEQSAGGGEQPVAGA